MDMNLTLAEIIRAADLMPGSSLVYEVCGSALRCLHFTAGVPALSGYDETEFRTFTDPFGMILEEDQLVIRQKVRRALQAKDTSQAEFLFRLKHRVQGFVWVHMSARILQETPERALILASITDVTGEMLNSQAIMEASGRSICVIEKDTKRILYANTLFYELIECTPAQAMGKHCYELLCKTMAMKFNDNCLCYSSINADPPIETYNPEKKMYMTMTGREIVWGEHEAYVFYLADITREKHKDALLEDSQKRFEVALENSDLMIWEYDIVNSRCINSEKAGRDYNIPLIIENYPESLYATGHTPPETIAQIKEVKRRLLAGETGFSVERRTIDKYGKSQWQKVEYSLECDETGKPLRAIVCGLDITAQKELEQKYNEQIAYRNSLAKKAMFSARLDLTADTIADYTCGEPVLEPLIKDAATADEFLQAFFRTSIFTPESGYTKESFLPAPLKAGYVLGQSQYHTTYQCSLLNRFLEINLTLSENPGNHHLEAFLILADVTESVLTHNAFQQIVNKDYDFVAVVDVKTGNASYLASTHNAAPLVNNSYNDSILSYAQAHRSCYYSEEDYRAVSSDMVLENIVKKLETMPVYEFNCKAWVNGVLQTYRMSFAYADALKMQLLYSRANITDAMYEEQKNRETLETALATAKKADRAKTDFLSRMSHDMRTPMNGILGIACLLRDRTDPEEIREDVNQIEISGRYLLSLINDTLDMSKIEAGKLELHPQPINSESLFGNVLTTTKILADSKGVALHVELPPISHGSWVPVWADPARVEQIFINIISNAVKFTPPGGVVVLHMETVAITDAEVVDRYRITDSGIGMSEEFQHHLFEPFTQEGRTNTGRESGTGLGLAIVKQIVELMHGEISVQSALNKGTSVTVTLHYPRYQGKLDVLPAPVADLRVLQGSRVLLCEDHPINAQIAIRLLAKQGVVVDHVVDGEKGVALFKNAPPHTYDAVLMDIRMPVLNGIEATRAIRTLPQRADAVTIPIIALTANAFDSDVRSYLAAGMNAHLAKPIDADKLYQTLAQQIATARDTTN